MADVFLSYARSSAAETKRVAAVLREQGFSVWLDEELPAHRTYADVIAAELDSAASVLVLWSDEAARSQWVRSEANRAREKGTLVQLRLDGARLPMPFDQIQCADLRHWSGEETPAWRSVIGAIESLVRGEPAGKASGQASEATASIGDGGSSDAQANALARQARHLARQEMEVERRAAADLFRQAIDRDPGFGLAYAGLADVLVQIARWHLPDWHETADEALAAARKAVELAPHLADSHLALGAVLALNHDPKAADAFSRALTISPDDPNAHYRMARFLVLLGDKAGAILHYERASELAPDDYRYIVYALQEYQALGDRAGEQNCLNRSAEAITRHLQRNPSDVRALGHGAGVMALLGRPAEMQSMIGRALKLRPNDYGNLATLACAVMLNGDSDQALDLLERAVATGQGDREWLKEDNDLKPLHGHPRFEALIAEPETASPPIASAKPVAGRRPLAVDRRLLIAGGSAAALAAAVPFAWRRLREPAMTPEAKLLLEKGLDALQSNDALDPEDVGSTGQAVALLTKATQAAPQSALAWGGLALAYAVRRRASPLADRPGLAARGREAANAALRLDPTEPRALAAMRVMEPLYRNWMAAEQADRSALSKNPRYPILLFVMSDMLGSVGRWREATELSNRLDRKKFLLPGAERKAILNMWAAGDLQQADEAIAAAVERWPDQRQVWRTRIAYLLYSGRATEALAILRDKPNHPRDLLPGMADAATATAEALTGAIDKAAGISANLGFLKTNPAPALPVTHAIVALGDAGTAFALLDGYYFGEGDWAALAPPGGDQDRQTSPLFQPPMRDLWRDARFTALVTRIGLTDYWQRSKTRPDYRRAPGR